MSGEELLEKIKRDGLESLGIFLSVYPGVVEDAGDPENSGRVKVTCPAVYGTNVSDWAELRGSSAGKNYGVWFPPEKGDPVWVTFRGGNPEFPLWEGGWFAKGQVPSKNLIIKTKAGQLIEIDQNADTVMIKNNKFHMEISKTGLFLYGAKKKQAAVLSEELIIILSEVFLDLSTAIAGGFPLSNATKYAAAIDKLKNILSTENFIS